LKHDLTEDELISALNAELKAQGISYQIDYGPRRGAETEARVKSAIGALVSEKLRPAQVQDIADRTKARRSTIYSALRRLVQRGEIIGGTEVGYIVKKSEG